MKRYIDKKIVDKANRDLEKIRGSAGFLLKNILGSIELCGLSLTVPDILDLLRIVFKISSKEVIGKEITERDMEVVNSLMLLVNSLASNDGEVRLILDRAEQYYKAYLEKKEDKWTNE